MGGGYSKPSKVPASEIFSTDIVQIRHRQSFFYLLIDQRVSAARRDWLCVSLMSSDLFEKSVVVLL